MDDEGLPTQRRLGILWLDRPVQIYREYESLQELRAEFDTNFRKARAFVAGKFEAHERQICEMVLIHPTTGEWFPLKTEVVHIAPDGIGLELADWGSARMAALERFIVEEPDGDDGTIESEEGPAAQSPDRILLSSPTPAMRIDVSENDGPPGLEFDHEADSSDEDGEQDPDFTLVPSSRPPPRTPREKSPPSSVAPASRPPPRNAQERVRNLNVRERDQVARHGNLSERVALERAYGAQVWDALLANTALTGPEVARIAKNGNATIPHLNVIVQNASWLTKAEVRRALLTNPKLTAPMVERVVRALPPAELRQLPQQTAYAPQVRAIARKFLPKS